MTLKEIYNQCTEEEMNYEVYIEEGNRYHPFQVVVDLSTKRIIFSVEKQYKQYKPSNLFKLIEG